MVEISKYDFCVSERKWQQIWEEKQIYKWNSNVKTDYVVDNPPPTISGVLHMGHIFSYTQADFIVRFQRMQGKNVFYTIGFDDNGLPTERLVEKVKKIRAQDLPRKEFVTQCHDISKQVRAEFKELFQSIALSVDWSQEYNTISEKSRTISQMSFIDLYQKEHLYRKLQPMLWDPVDQTAIAQAEIEDKEQQSHMNYINFCLHDDHITCITIATTRPELLPACVAVLYHPEDERYNKYGTEQFLKVPLFNTKVPFIADENVKMDKGTGAVMCCTFGDEMDIEWWQKYNLETKIAINKKAIITGLYQLFGYHMHNNPDVIFETERLYCRKFNHDDIELIRLLHTNEQVRQYTTKGIVDAQDSKIWLDYLIMHQEKQGYSEWAVFEKETNKFVGKAGPLSIQDAFYPCDLTVEETHVTTDTELEADSYVNIEAFFLPEAWYHGYAHEFFISAIDWCIDNILDKKIISLRHINDDKGLHLLDSIAMIRNNTIDINHVYKTNQGKINKYISYSLDTEVFYSNNVSQALTVKNLEGLHIKQARSKILDILKTGQYLVKQEEITHTVKCSERSGANLEIIPTHQWFIRVIDKKDELKNKASQCNWYPKHMETRIQQWIDGLNWDWCISRQRYFGVPIPVWYSKRKGEEGKVILPALSQLPVDPLTDLPAGYSKDELEPDYDVMDTWATSSVSPQLSSQAISKDYALDINRHQQLFPTNLRPQSHEIIRSWAFYTIVKAYLHENVTPWKDLMISGWCLAPDRTKMSKSKGNAITPVNLIKDKGADTVRYWASTSNLGVDIAYSEDAFRIGNKLIKKIQNVAKYVSIHMNKNPEYNTLTIDSVTETVDRWILLTLDGVITKATAYLENYEYCKAREEVEEFFWHYFCDNYLEISKVRLYGEQDNINTAGKLSALYAVCYCFEVCLKLFAPYIPHITDELYSALYNSMNSIHSLGQWPKLLHQNLDKHSQNLGNIVLEILFSIRKIKAQMNISIKQTIDKIIILHNEDTDFSHFEQVRCDILNATNSLDIEVKHVPSNFNNNDETYIVSPSGFYVKAELADIVN